MRKNIASKIIFLKMLTKALLFFIILIAFSFAIFYGPEFYQGAFRENIGLEKINNIEVKEAIVVNFSVPVLRADYASGIKITPAEKVQFNFSSDKRRLTIAPRENWNPGVRYVIHFPAGKSAMLTAVKEGQLSFFVSPFPEVKDVTPSDGAKDVIIGAEDPVVVNFSRSVAGYFVKFAFEPESEIAYQINSERDQFKILPKDKIQDGKKYDLTIFAKITDAPDSTYQQIYAQSFVTMPALAPLVVWEKDFSLRLDQARKYTEARIKEGKYVDVNLKTQIMTTFENGNILNAYLISSGKRGMETPIGDHKIYNKFPRAYSKAYGLFMPYWMAIVPDGKMGIHELPEWPGGYKEGANHLGTPVSHGCMRLGVGAAQTVYDWAEIGTPVIVY